MYKYVLPFAMLLAARIVACVSTTGDDPAEQMRAERRRHCKQANAECSLGCGTPDVMESRIGDDRTRDYMTGYVRCTAACDRHYRQCVERITANE
jgi:hypothetical protein